MDIDEIRRENIRLLEAEAGSLKALAQAAGMSYAQCLNYKNGVADSRTGKIRGMRKDTAWRFEDAGKKPRGWLDLDHRQSKDTDIRAVVSIMESLEAEQRARLRGRIEGWLERDPPPNPPPGTPLQESVIAPVLRANAAFLKKTPRKAPVK